MGLLSRVLNLNGTHVRSDGCLLFRESVDFHRDVGEGLQVGGDGLLVHQLGRFYRIDFDTLRGDVDLQRGNCGGVLLHLARVGRGGRRGGRVVADIPQGEGPDVVDVVGRIRQACYGVNRDELVVPFDAVVEDLTGYEPLSGAGASKGFDGARPAQYVPAGAGDGLAELEQVFGLALEYTVDAGVVDVDINAVFATPSTRTGVWATSAVTVWPRPCPSPGL